MGSECSTKPPLQGNNYSDNDLGEGEKEKKRRILQRGTINSWWKLYYGSDVNDFVAGKVKLDSKYKWVQRPIRSNPTKSERDMMAHCTYYGYPYHYKEQSSPH